MSDGHEQLDRELERLQGLLTTLESTDDPAAKSAARGLVQAVMDLHAVGLHDLLDVVHEAGDPPAEQLLARFAANPRIAGVLLLHDLHPEDFAARAREVVERLRPHLGVRGIRVELVSAEAKVLRLSVTASGQHGKRPAAEEVRRNIDDAVATLTPDAADVVIDGLDEAGGANEAYVPLTSITRSAGGTGRIGPATE